MVISLYSEIRFLFKEVEKNWSAKLKELELWENFAPIYAAAKTHEVANRRVAYLVFTYSRDSDFIIQKMDWLENKIQIIEKVGLKPSEETELIHLEVPIYKDLMFWILYRLKNELWREYMVLKEVRNTFLETAVEQAPENITYDDRLKLQQYKMSCIIDAKRLLDMINAIDERLLTEERNLAPAKYEMQKVTGYSFEEQILKKR